MLAIQTSRRQSRATTLHAGYLLLCFVWCSPAARSAEPAPDSSANPSAKWEKDIQAFEAKDKEAMPPAGGILFIGSSTIRFWDVNKSFPGMPVYNRGFGGSQMADAAAFADRIAIPYKPATIILYDGDNDLAAGKTPEQIFGDFKTFEGKVRAALPKTKIICLGIKPSIARWNLIDKIRATDKLLSEHCAKGKGLSYLETEPIVLGADGKPRAELFRQDGLHLNEKGYELLSAKLKPLLSSQTAKGK